MSGSGGGRHRLAGLAVTLALTVPILAGCGRGGDGVGSAARDATTVGPAGAADTAGADPSTGPTGDGTSEDTAAAAGTGSSAATTPPTGRAGADAIDTVGQDDLADLERTLDEIDQVLADLEAELAQD